MRSWKELRSFLCMKVGVVGDNCGTWVAKGAALPEHGSIAKVAYFDAVRRFQQIFDGLEAADTAHQHH